MTTLSSPPAARLVPVALISAVLTATLLAGCSTRISAGTEAGAASSGTRSALSTPQPAPSEAEDTPPPGDRTPTPPARPTPRSPRQVVDDPRSSLNGVWVVRGEGGFAVDTWWGRPDRPAERAVASSTDGFATAQYARLSERTGYEWFPVPTPPGPRPDLAELEGLLQSPAHTTVDRVRAVVGGGDGATLFPFQAVARSTDRGATWRRFDVPRFDGEMAYVSGEAVLPGGRLLVLLSNFSDDRRGDPSPRHHGLWVSLGGDWSSYTELVPTFDPPLLPTEHGWPSAVGVGASPEGGGVVWVTTWDDRLYVSTDGAATFREIPAR